MRREPRAPHKNDDMTEAQRARMIRAYEWGCGFDDLAQRFGRSTNTIRAILIEAGIKLRPRHEARTMSFDR